MLEKINFKVPYKISCLYRFRQSKRLTIISVYETNKEDICLTLQLYAQQYIIIN